MANYAGLLEYKPVEFTDIGKGIIGAFEKDIRSREERKKELDDLTVEASEKVGQFDPTKIGNINEVGFRIGAVGRQRIQALHDSLLKGELLPEDFKRQMNNILTSTAQSGQRLRNIATDIEEFNKRQDVASAAEIQTNKYMIEMFSDPTLNPVYDKTGMLVLVDGKTGNVMNTNPMFMKRDKFDPISSLDNQMKGLGKYTTQNAQGQYVVREGGMAGITKAKKDTVASLTGDDNNIVDILTLYPDATRENYVISTDPQDKDKDNVIFMKWDGEKMVPDTTSSGWNKQRKEATKYLERLFDERVDYTYKAPQKATSTASGTGNTEEDVSNRRAVVNSITSMNLSSPYNGLVLGKQLPRMQAIGSGGEDVSKQEYEGYVVTDWEATPDGKGVNVTVKNAKNQQKKIVYTMSNWIDEINTLLNAEEGTKVRTSNLIGSGFRSTGSSTQAP